MNKYSFHVCAWLLLVMAVCLLTVGCSGVHASLPENTAPEATVYTEESSALLPLKLPFPKETVLAKGCPLPLEDWRLQLVNWAHPIGEEPDIDLTWVRADIYVDSRCYEDLSAMLETCRSEGLTPLVCSGYRDLAYQTELFENKIQRLQSKGMTEQEAYESARTIVAIPGTSEHHLGLAVDIVDYSYQELNEQQEQTAVQKWLMEHCWEYGFILRYPNGKSDITGIVYEPWHYRYVGREVAAEIWNSGLCMEEYLNQFRTEQGTSK